MSSSDSFQKLIEVVRDLRHPQTGCPWDLEQNHQTLRPYLIEECYEVLEAIDRNDDRHFAEELGDLLLQVVLHAQLANERKAFDIERVVTFITEKMISRHPHVFGDVSVSGSAEVLKNWEQIKLKEKEGRNEKPSNVSPVLEGVPKSMPALGRAQRLGEKAAKVGFDWRELHGVWEKVNEEIGELEEELPGNLHQAAPKLKEEKKARISHELGDVLFALAQFARWAGINAEDALRESCERFTDRFSEMERRASEPLSILPDEKLEELWQNAKRTLRK